MRWKITCFAVCAAMRPKSFGRVVPLAGDVALFVELLRDHLDVAGLDVDLDQRLLGRVGHALVRGDERVRERLEHDLDRDALLALDVLERLHHLGVHRRAASFVGFCFGPARASGCGAPLEHRARLRDVGVRDVLGAAVVERELEAVVVGVDRARRGRGAPAPSAARNFTETVVADRAAEVRRACAAAARARGCSPRARRGRERGVERRLASSTGESASVAAGDRLEVDAALAVDEHPEHRGPGPMPVTSTS